MQTNVGLQKVIFSPILEDVLFVGLVGEDLTKRRFVSDWRQYQDCFEREITLQMFEPDAVFKEDSWPYFNKIEGSAIRKWRRTVCCGKVQAAGLAACSECKTPFVCLYKDSLYIPVLGIARNDTDCVQLISNVLTKGLNLFPIKDGLQKAGYPNDVSGVRIASSSVGGHDG